MSWTVLSLVLAAAAMHAGWNASVKTAADPLMRLVLINGGFLLCGAPLLFTGIPARESWSMLALSIALHQLYYALLVNGYRAGDLSTVYPISRGSAPAWVALGAWLWAGERVGRLGLAAIALIVLGVASLATDKLPLAAEGGGGGKRNAPVLIALATGVTIAGYSVADGLGGRASKNVLAYVGWLLFLEAIPIVGFAAILRRERLRRALRSSWRAGLAGGAMAFAGYGLVIWAMVSTPMGYVSALREVSVVLAAIIGTRLLGEPLGRRRVATAAVVAAGVVLLQLSRP